MKKYSYIITFNNKVMFSGFCYANNYGEANGIAQKKLNIVMKAMEEIDDLEFAYVGAVSAEVTIMNTNNGHNAKLVDAINICYGDEKYYKNFIEIVKALYNRDHVAFSNIWDDECPYWDAEYFSFEKMADRVGINDLLHNFLQKNCDDNDLEVIIKFCGYQMED